MVIPIIDIIITKAIILNINKNILPITFPNAMSGIDKIINVKQILIKFIMKGSIKGK